MYMYNYKKENIPRSSFSGHYLIFLSCVNASAVSFLCWRQRDGRGQMESDVLLLPEGSRGYGRGALPLPPSREAPHVVMHTDLGLRRTIIILSQ